MSASLLGPSNCVPPEQAVVVQCVTSNASDTRINFPAFTQGDDPDTHLCSDNGGLMTVFCNLAGKDLNTCKFVGVVASHPTMHGKHGHVSVWVRGVVTMACNLGNLRHVRPMAILEWTSHTCHFAGTPLDFEVATVQKMQSSFSVRVVGTLLELGRQPNNEIRVILAPGTTHRGVDQINAEIATQNATDPMSRTHIDWLTLSRCDKIIQAHTKATAKEKTALVALRHFFESMTIDEFRAANS